MKLKSLILKLFQLNLPSFLFIFKLVWIKIGSRSITETKELGRDGSSDENQTTEPGSWAEREDEVAAKETLVGNHVKQEINNSSNLPNKAEDNINQAIVFQAKNYHSETLVKNEHTKNGLDEATEYSSETPVKIEDKRDHLDKTSNEDIDEMDSPLKYKSNTENEGDNAVKMDDKSRKEFIPSPSLDGSLNLGHASRNTKHNEVSLCKGTALDSDNEEHIRTETDVNMETTDCLLECIDSGSDTSTDMEDGFMKLMKMCAGGRAGGKTKKMDEDDDMHGFDEKSEKAKSKRSSRKKPSFRRSSGVSPVSPTPFSVHYDDIKTQTAFDFRTRPKQGTTTRTVIEKEVSAQQETGLCSEIVDGDQYNFSFPQRGHMVLIVNDRFRRQSPRDGAKWDLQKTKQIASKLGFRIFNSNHCTNLTKRETISILRQAQNMDHSDSDCFILVISTHGLEMPNPRAKGKLDHVIVCSDDQLIFTSNILEMFNEKNCPSLKNKPKIFFIQACRGEKFDTGSKVHVLKTTRNEDRTDVAKTMRDRFGRVKPPSVDVTDTRPSGDSWAASGHRSTAHAQLSPPIRSQPGEARARSPTSADPCSETGDHSQTYVSQAQISIGQSAAGADDQRFFQTSQLLRKSDVNENSNQRPYPINESPSLQCDNDFLVMYAIPPGYFAWRNTADGSWMIDYLYKTVMAYDMKKPTDFLKLLRKVTMRMSARQTNTPSDPGMHEMKAVSVIEHKLVKDIVFKPKAVQSAWLRQDTTFLI